MAGGIVGNIMGLFRPGANQKSGGAFEEIGVSGTPIYGGFVVPPPGTRRLATRLTDTTAILRDVSIVAAGLRYFLNLTARPTWKANPPDDKPASKEAAEFMESVLYGMSHSWSRAVRRQGMYRFHGFGVHEWIAKRRDDGRIGIHSVEARPAHTIRRWDVDEAGNVLGVIQVGPQTGQEIYLPRRKVLHLVDDTFTDSPEGLGWFEHLHEPVARLREYLALEKVGFQRDLSGIPVGRAPLQQINKAVKDGAITQAEADKMVEGIKSFVAIRAKQPDTGLVLDSQPFVAKSDTGTTVSSTLQWGLELLTGDPGTVTDLGNAIRRINFDLALILGVESLLTGREGAGSLALSEDKSRGLHMNINSTTADMAETCNRDLVDVVWAMNGLPEETKPELTVEDASFKDAEKVARVLAEMANAGAVLAPDDPAIDDVRDMLGVSPQPEMDEGMMGRVSGGKPTDPLDPGSSPEDPEEPTTEGGNAD